LFDEKEREFAYGTDHCFLSIRAIQNICTTILQHLAFLTKFSPRCLRKLYEVNELSLYKIPLPRLGGEGKGEEGYQCL
jgi:hypothetical protein